MEDTHEHEDGESHREGTVLDRREPSGQQHVDQKI